MELEELDVAELRAGAVRERPAIRGRDPGIGGDGVELPDPARGEDD
jgi:hypothetical protein